MPNPSAAAAVLMDDPDRYSAALQCAACPLNSKCGGLHCKASPLGCEEFCCGGKKECTTVCPRHPDFLLQIAEVGGFDLSHLPHCRPNQVRVSERVLPLVYHGSSRAERLPNRAVAVRLRDLIDFERGTGRYRSRAELCSALQLQQDTEIVVSGVDHDPIVERIWSLFDLRRRVFEDLAVLDLACVTTPNFSMILDVPRHDNLHAMQRIGIIYNEMSDAGLRVALHVNGRTERDFLRWAEFLRERPYISVIAYEFITGSGLHGRLPKHVDWLNRMQQLVGRPLLCILRGNPAALDLLNPAFSPVYIETTAFVKTMKRQVSLRYGNFRLRWNTERTPLLDLSSALVGNLAEVRASLVARYPQLALGFE